MSCKEETVLMHLVSSANKRGVADCTESGRSLIKMINMRGPRMLPCGTPEVTGSLEEKVPSIATD